MSRTDYEAARPTWHTAIDSLKKFEQAPGVMLADKSVLAQRIVPEELDIRAIHDVLRIERCGEGRLSVRFIKAVYTRSDGTTVEQTWSEAWHGRPDPAIVVPPRRGCSGCSEPASAAPKGIAVLLLSSAVIAVGRRRALRRRARR